MRAQIHKWSWKLTSASAVIWAGIHLVKNQQPTHSWYDLLLYAVFALGLLLLVATWEPLACRRYTLHFGSHQGRAGVWLKPPKKSGTKRNLNRETAQLILDVMRIKLNYMTTHLPPEDLTLVRDSRRKAMEDGESEDDAWNKHSIPLFNELQLKRNIAIEEELQERIADVTRKYVERGLLTSDEAESLSATRLVARPLKPGDKIELVLAAVPPIEVRLEELRKQL